jgi:cytoskeleton protein RodZ
MSESVAVSMPTDPQIAEPASSADLSVQMAASNDTAVSDVAMPVLAGVGELLRSAREKNGLSVNDIAGKLRMGVKQVQALEAGEYAVLPKGTFLRGFVRNYAKMVSLNGDEAIALLEKTHSGASLVVATPQVAPVQQNIKVQQHVGEIATPKARALVTLIVAAALIGVAWYWWEFIRPAKPAVLPGQNLPLQTSAVNQPAITPPAGVPLPPAPIATPAATSAPAMSESSGEIAKRDPMIVPPTGSIASAPVVAQPLATPPKPVTAETKVAVENSTSQTAKAPAVAKVPAGSSTLGFTFSGESWVEVTDAGGKILVSKRFKAGDAEEVFGRGPLSVVIGNAQVTRMASNGREFDLVPHTRVSVARVTVK